MPDGTFFEAGRARGGAFGRGLQPGLSNLGTNLLRAASMQESGRQFDASQQFEERKFKMAVKQFQVQQRQKQITTLLSQGNEELKLSKEPNQSDTRSLEHYNNYLRSHHQARILGGRTDIGSFKPVTMEEFRPGRSIRSKTQERLSKIFNRADLTSFKGLQEYEIESMRIMNEGDRQLSEKGLPVATTNAFKESVRSQVDSLRKSLTQATQARKGRYKLGKPGEQLIDIQDGVLKGTQIPFKPEKSIERIRAETEAKRLPPTKIETAEERRKQQAFEQETEKRDLEIQKLEKELGEVGTGGIWVSAGSTEGGVPVLRNNKTGAYKKADTTGVGAIYPALQNPSAQTAKDIATLSNLKELMTKVSADLRNEEGYNAFREDVGFLRGNYKKLADRFVGINPETSRSFAELAHAFEMVYALSGKQVSDKEIARFKPFLPDPTLPLDTLVVRLKALDDYLGTLESKIKSSSASAGRPFRDVAPGPKVEDSPERKRQLRKLLLETD